jgi:hypothetical protein
MVVASCSNKYCGTNFISVVPTSLLIAPGLRTIQFLLPSPPAPAVMIHFPLPRSNCPDWTLYIQSPHIDGCCNARPDEQSIVISLCSSCLVGCTIVSFAFVYAAAAATAATAASQGRNALPPERADSVMLPAQLQCTWVSRRTKIIFA